MANILVLNGPNLNLLGAREVAHYGSLSLEEINTKLTNLSAELGHVLTCHQSNSESALIDIIQLAPAHKIDFIIFNPAAFTHTSIALRDALLAVAVPFVEIHLSNIHKREVFRHQSYFSDIAVGTISGLGSEGYCFALQYAHKHLQGILINS